MAAMSEGPASTGTHRTRAPDIDTSTAQPVQGSSRKIPPVVLGGLSNSSISRNVRFNGELDVRIRPVSPDDDVREDEFVKSLSDETQLKRFFYPRKIKSKAEIQRLTHVDYLHGEFALAAVDVEKDRFIGVARYYNLAPRCPNECEVAVALRDDYQGKGIGSYLMEYLVEIAIRHDFRFIVAEVLFDNHSARHMMDRFKKRYPTKVTSPGGGCVSYRVDVRVSPAAAVAAEALKVDFASKVHDEEAAGDTNASRSSRESELGPCSANEIVESPFGAKNSAAVEPASDGVEDSVDDLEKLDMPSLGISAAGKLWSGF